MANKTIKVLIDVDTEIIKDVAEMDDLSEAISTELNWLHDSGMTVNAWEYVEE